MITEQVRDHRRVENNQVRGSVVYTYTSPTHWGSDGLCEIKVEYWDKNKPVATLSYGAGGCNTGFSHLEIAEAMAEAFTLAKIRLQVLLHECVIEK